MRKIFILCIPIFVSLAAPACAQSCHSRGGAGGTPEVEYIQPRNDHDADLTGKESLTFEWRSLPKPGGGREAYRFELFEGAEDAYNRIYNADLRPDVYTMEIPADMFKDGMQYTWRVKQRDAHSSVWSRAGDRWRFTARKGGAEAVPVAASATK